MTKPIKFDETGDSADLQALFDSIAVGAAPAAPVAEPEPSGDSADLQALFDSVVSQVDETAAPSAGGETDRAATPQEAVFNRIGHMARQLHDSLRELGYDKSLEETARQIPDARERLDYIVKMTEQAASRVLNATDVAKPAQDALGQAIKSLGGRWEKMFANQLSVDEFKQLAADTRVFFAAAPDKVAVTNAQLTEIIMAQDFQDLTGQVIKKMMEVINEVETQLMQVLIDHVPKGLSVPEDGESLQNGPQIKPGQSSGVSSQQEADDLLASLGF